MTARVLPSFDELPKFHDFSGCAWEVWGKGDQLGTVNLLTEEVVKEAAQEIKTGKSVCLNWPIQFLNKPAFHRQSPQHEVWTKADNGTVNDDALHINTQSGSQWDGLRHFGVIEHGVLYQNTLAKDAFPRGNYAMPDPTNIDPEVIKLGIHNWAQHGICGRGVLLDLVHYYTASGAPLSYDPWSTHGFPLADLLACAKEEGVTFKQGDILLIRGGFMQKYYAATTTQEEREALSARPEAFAGIEQSEDMKRFLWDNHFAAAASDQPTLERWPPEGPHLHQTLLGLWGMPIGEFFDLEALSKACQEAGRYTFFFSSWPLNVLGGVASPPNAAAYF